MSPTLRALLGWAVASLIVAGVFSLDALCKRLPPGAGLSSRARLMRPTPVRFPGFRIPASAPVARGGDASPSAVGHDDEFYDPDDVRCCTGCGTRIPTWPAGWLNTDDGRALCPSCSANVRLLGEKSILMASLDELEALWDDAARPNLRVVEP